MEKVIGKKNPNRAFEELDATTEKKKTQKGIKEWEDDNM